MICLNEFEKEQTISEASYLTFLQLLAPFAPHISDTLWYSFGNKVSIHKSTWPKYNPKKLIDDEMVIVVQINGKLRAEITTSIDIIEETLKAQALEHEKILPWIEGKEIKRIIYIPSKLINIVC
jgi:leucyl-tRNA synthetase